MYSIKNKNAFGEKVLKNLPSYIASVLPSTLHQFFQLHRTSSSNYIVLVLQIGLQITL